MAFTPQQVSVGSLVDPAEGFQRGLSNLTKQFNLQAASEEQALKDAKDRELKDRQFEEQKKKNAASIAASKAATKASVAATKASVASTEASKQRSEATNLAQAQEQIDNAYSAYVLANKGKTDGFTGVTQVGGKTYKLDPSSGVGTTAQNAYQSGVLNQGKINEQAIQNVLDNMGHTVVTPTGDIIPTKGPGEVLDQAVFDTARKKLKAEVTARPDIAKSLGELGVDRRVQLTEEDKKLPPEEQEALKRELVKRKFLESPEGKSTLTAGKTHGTFGTVNAVMAKGIIKIMGKGKELIEDTFSDDKVLNDKAISKLRSEPDADDLSSAEKFKKWQAQRNKDIKAYVSKKEVIDANIDKIVDTEMATKTDLYKPQTEKRTKATVAQFEKQLRTQLTDKYGEEADAPEVKAAINRRIRERVKEYDKELKALNLAATKASLENVSAAKELKGKALIEKIRNQGKLKVADLKAKNQLNIARYR